MTVNLGKHYFFTLLACFLVFSGNAQNFVFKVVINKGLNQFRENPDTNWNLIKKGLTLESENEVRVVDNAYLGMVHSNGRLLEIRRPGTFKISDVESKSGILKKGLPSEYIEFIRNTIIERKTADDPGSVQSRGIEGIRLHIPLISAVYNPNIIISWEVVDNDSDVHYTITFLDIFDNKIYRVETYDTKINVDLNNSELAGESLIMVTVAKGGRSMHTSPIYTLQRLTQEEGNAIANQLDPFSEIDNGSSLDQIILAGFYEKNRLLIDAAYHYLLAIELAPSVEDFKNFYQDFLDRNDLRE